MNQSVALSEALLRLAGVKAAELTEQLTTLTDSTVMLGPFAGMKLPSTASWGEGDIAPKLLGTYEQELHVSIETLLKRKPEFVVNVGCAEGYYAVGLARRLPGVIVYAFDSKPQALDICYEAAVLNGVQSQIEYYGKCTPGDMKRSFGSRRGLYVIDCEGAELEILADGTIPTAVRMRYSDLLIETHDFKNPHITELLTKQFDNTHELLVLREGARDPSGYEVLKNLNTLERYLCVCENRPCLMRWIVATAKEV